MDNESDSTYVSRSVRLHSETLNEKKTKKIEDTYFAYDFASSYTLCYLP